MQKTTVLYAFTYYDTLQQNGSLYVNLGTTIKFIEYV